MIGPDGDPDLKGSPDPDAPERTPTRQAVWFAPIDSPTGTAFSPEHASFARVDGWRKLVFLVPFPFLPVADPVEGIVLADLWGDRLTATAVWDAFIAGRPGFDLADATP